MRESSNPFMALAYVIMFLAIQVMAQWIVLAISHLATGTSISELGATGTIISMALFSVAAIALFTWARWSPVSRQYIVSRPWDVLFWCFIAAIGAVAPSLYLQELLPSWPQSIQEYVDQMEALAAQIMSTRGGYAVVCLLAPVAEEVVFRGAVLRTLLAWKPERRWLMISLSALLFAAAHLNPAQMVHPFLVGLLLGWMYERTGSIVPGVVYHWANNTVAYLLFHVYPNPEITLTDIFGTHGRAVMAVLFSLLIILPAIYQLHMRMRKVEESSIINPKD
jgi:hypothetical protein